MMKRAATADLVTVFDTPSKAGDVGEPRRSSHLQSVAPDQQCSVKDAKSSSLDVELLRGRDAFLELEPEWNALFARAGEDTQIFQQFNWLWHCDQVYGQGPKAPEIIIVAARLNGRLVLAWPLQLICARGLCQLTWFGDPVGQYGDVLIDDLPEAVATAALQLTWKTLCEAVHPDLVVLRRVRSDAKVRKFLTDIGIDVIEETAAPVMDLAKASSFEAYCQTEQTRQMRKERRRLARRFAELGAVEFRRIDDPDEAIKVAHEAIDLKREWLSRKSLVSKTLADDRVLTFFERVAGRSERPVGCEVHGVWCGDQLAGAQIAFKCGTRLLVHVIVYNVAFSKAGAGGLQLAELMKQAFDRDLTHVDLLAPMSDYKMAWANDATLVADHIYAPTARGRAFLNLYLKRLRPALKSLMPHVPKRIRNWAHI